ncbi:uncharacterized protein LOC26527817 [Drosophila mojavensis]|uniref:Uncharacterized protein n=1 Tax=Drosophila mojavensis TaxID=7230 RepID=A0A0Q9XLD6_DROMO|nr:uncharacterized protein LOC26527817 [Drosophila mojavensis]KRG05127.1 uncharacterized protein Dmoj_GI26176 [Drosophila mojavensis]
MCGCVWVDWVKPGRAVYRILCFISIVLQVVVASLLLYILIAKDNDEVTITLSIILFIILISLSLALSLILWKENLFSLKVYIVCYIFVSLTITIYLLLFIIHLIGYTYSKSWQLHMLFAVFTAKCIYKMTVLILYADALQKQI